MPILADFYWSPNKILCQYFQIIKPDTDLNTAQIEKESKTWTFIKEHRKTENLGRAIIFLMIKLC